MNVRVRLFAILRERAGRDAVEVELGEGATVADALRELAELPGLREPLERMPVRMAVNREYADASTPLAAEDELALIPPISGGAAAIHVAVSEQPLDPNALQRLVGHPGAGAIVCFQGVTREVARLDYEAYGEMAEARMRSILEECVERHELLAVAAEHRIGAVPLGEPAVVVAVSAGHRGEAFAGAREAIDRIKAEAPIWKREVEADGERRWVEGTAAPAREPGASA
ncbi:MAG: molybdenum cofactor biosynthesis protein MoaE [Actinobacteria bacterium]|nr:molybdenum cofactor biosynthesis protein MoaE [Actinomycetota bacterium]